MSKPAMSNQGWQRIASVAEVAEGAVIAARVGKSPIALYKFEGRIYASDDACTHECVRLSDGYLDGCFIECPLHQGVFDIRTGKALCEPLTEDLAVYPVRIVGDEVFVMLADPATE
jgi:naphthalene 1,2-dioxygenase ferredoxin component